VGDASATNFTVQRASNAAFTRGVSSETVTGLTITRTLDPKTTYYYRIRANNAYGSSGWTNASPFPVKTP